MIKIYLVQQAALQSTTKGYKAGHGAEVLRAFSTREKAEEFIQNKYDEMFDIELDVFTDFNDKNVENIFDKKFIKDNLEYDERKHGKKDKEYLENNFKQKYKDLSREKKREFIQKIKFNFLFITEIFLDV